MASTRLNLAVSTTIASGGTVSSKVDQSNTAIGGFVIPSAFTGTVVSFQVSADDTTYQALSDETGTAVSVPVSVGRSYAAPAALAPWPFVKFVSGTAEAAARTVVAVLKS